MTFVNVVPLTYHYHHLVFSSLFHSHLVLLIVVFTWPPTFKFHVATTLERS